MSAASADTTGDAGVNARTGRGARARVPWSGGGCRAVVLTAALGVGSTRAHAQAPDVKAAPSAGQLADWIAHAGDRTVRFRYAVRAGVCGDGLRNVTVPSADGSSRDGAVWSERDGGWALAPCEPGPARVTLVVRGGIPREVRLAVGARGGARGSADRGRSDTAGVLDLGAVPAAAAAAYLLDVAARDEVAPGGRLLLGAVVADSAVVWPRLLELARDERLTRATRREATFWVSRAACDAAAARAERAAPADTADREVRKQVVFALSQRPDDTRAAALTRVARADRDPAVRCAALFWLGQDGRASAADAERTLRLLEDVLRRP